MPQKNVIQFTPVDMLNRENKVLVLGSGPLGGSSWRWMVEEKLYTWSFQSGGCVGLIVSTEDIHIVTYL